MISFIPETSRAIDRREAQRAFDTFGTLPPEEQAPARELLLKWRDQELAAEAQAKEQHLKNIFTDPDYFQKQVRSNPLVEAIGTTPFQQGTQHRAAILAYLSEETKTSPKELDPIYPQTKRAWAKQHLGQDKVLDDAAMFAAVGKHYQRADQKDAQVGRIMAQMTRTSIDQLTGGEGDILLDFNAWWEENRELFGEDQESDLIDRLAVGQAEFMAKMEPYAPLVKGLFDLIASNEDMVTDDVDFSKIEVSKEDENAVMDRLLELSVEDRQMIYGIVASYAEAMGQEDRTFWQNLGKKLVETFPRFGGVVNRIMEHDVVSNNVSNLRSEEPVYRGMHGQEERIFSAAEKQENDQSLQPLLSISSTPLTDEERAGLLQQNEKAQKELQLAREIDGLIRGTINPVKANAKGLLGDLEQGLYDFTDSIPYSALALIPYAGIPLVAGSLYAMRYDELLAKYPHEDPERLRAAAALTAIPNALVERFQMRMLFGRVPGFSTLLEKMTARGLPFAAKAGVYLGGNLAGQNAQEFIQDGLDLLAEQTMLALNEDMPSPVWREAWEELLDSRKQVFFATLPMIGIGGGVWSYREIRNGSAYTRDLTNLREMGFSAADAKAISNLADPAARDAAIAEKWETRSPENIAAGANMAMTRMRAVEKGLQDPELPHIEIEMRDEKETFVLRDKEGNELLATRSENLARRALAQTATKKWASQQQEVAALVEHYKGLATADGKDQTFLTTEKTTLQDEVEAGVVTVEQARERVKIAAASDPSIDPDAPLSDIWVLGSSESRFVDGVWKDTIRLSENANPLTVIEERAEAEIKHALAEGRITMDWLQDQLESYSWAFGENIDTSSEQKIMEETSRMAVAYASGKLKDSQLPSGLRGWFRSVLQYFKEVLRMGVRLKKAFREGKMDAEFEKFLAESVGISPAQVAQMRGEQVLTEELAGGVSFSIEQRKVTPADEAEALSLAEKALEGLPLEQQALLRRVAEHQSQRVLDFWRDKPGFMLAPNGQPSKLTERQWAQVRTPLFKRWFGDWESVAAANHVSDIDPVLISSIPEATKDAREKAIESAKSQIAATDGIFRHPSGIKIKISGNKLGHWTAFSADPRKIALLENISAAIRNSIYVKRDIPDSRKQADQNIKGFHKLIVPVDFKTGKAVASITLQEEANGIFVYDGKVEGIEINFEPASSSSSTGTNQSLGEIKQAQLKATLKLLNVNPESVSRVRDENGEPMVVWHYSPAKGISEFLPFARDILNGNKTRQEVLAIIDRWKHQMKRGYMTFRAGTFFTPQRGTYSGYGENEYGMFLRAVNPVTKNQGQEATAPSESLPIDALMMDMEGDGIIREIAVFDPNQIKSATDNIGTFTESGNMTFSISPKEAFFENPAIEVLAENGLLSRAGALKRWGKEKYDDNKSLWDDAPTLSHPSHNAIYDKDGLAPDKAASLLADYGLLPHDATEADLWNLISGASQSAVRRAADERNQAMNERRMILEMKSRTNQLAEAMAKLELDPEYRRDRVESARRRLDNLRETFERRKRKEGADANHLDVIRAFGELEAIIKILPKTARGNISFQLGKLAGYKTELGRTNQILRKIENVDRAFEEWLKGEYQTKMETLLFKRSMPAKDKPGEKPKGKADAGLHALFAKLREAYRMDENQAQAQVAALESQIASGEMTVEQETAVTMEANLTSLLSPWKHKSAIERKAALDAATQIWQEGYQAFQEKLAKERERYDAIRKKVIASSGKTGSRIEREQIKTFLSLFQMLKAKNKDVHQGLLNFEQNIGTIFGHDSEITKTYADAQRKAENRKMDALLETYRQVEGFFKDLAGGGLAGRKLAWAMAQKTGKHAINPAKVSGGISLGAQEWNFTMSEFEAISTLLMWRQEDGRRHMIGSLDENGRPAGAWHYNQTFIDRIEAQLSKEGRAFLDFLITEYGNEWPSLNVVFREQNGIDLPYNPRYSPIAVDPMMRKSGQEIDPLSGMGFTPGSGTPGSLRTRSALAVAEPRFPDALQQFLAHRKEIEHYKAFAGFNREMRRIFGHRDVLNAAEAKVGRQGRDLLAKWADFYELGGVRDAASFLEVQKYFGSIMGNAITVALVGRVGTLAIQMTQIGAASAEIGLRGFVVQLSKLLSGNLNWKAAWDSPYIQRRIDEQPAVVRQMIEGMKASKPNLLKYSSERMGRLLGEVDAFWTAATYAMIYDHELGQARANGMSGAEAENYARNEADRKTDRVAQPTRTGSRSFLEVSASNPYFKIAWAFASEPRKNYALMAYAAWNREAKDMARALFYVIVIGAIMGSVIRAAWRDLRDDDDDEIFDEKNWNWKNLALMSATEWMYGFPLVGEVAQNFILKSAGQHTFDGGLLSTITDAVPAVKRIPDMLSGEMEAEEIFRDVDKMLSAAGYLNKNFAAAATFSHVARDLFGVGKNLKGDE